MLSFLREIQLAQLLHFKVWFFSDNHFIDPCFSHPYGSISYPHVLTHHNLVTISFNNLICDHLALTSKRSYPSLTQIFLLFLRLLFLCDSNEIRLWWCDTVNLWCLATLHLALSSTSTSLLGYLDNLRLSLWCRLLIIAVYVVKKRGNLSSVSTSHSSHSTSTSWWPQGWLGSFCCCKLIDSLFWQRTDYEAGVFLAVFVFFLTLSSRFKVWIGRDTKIPRPVSFMTGNTFYKRFLIIDIKFFNWSSVIH